MSSKKRNNTYTDPTAAEPDGSYKVGPGCPPKANQWPPGTSGNPKGAKPKQASIAPDLKAALARALGKKITLKQGDKQRLVTMAAAGIEQLVAQYAKGDRHARRDIIWLAEKLGVDLMNDGRKALQEALVSNHEVILEAYVERQYDKMKAIPRVMAPPELLDDDGQDKRSK